MSETTHFVVPLVQCEKEHVRSLVVADVLASLKEKLEALAKNV
jgi:hypothetical protein